MSSISLYSYYVDALEAMYIGIPQNQHPTTILSSFIDLATLSSQFLKEISSKFSENQFSSTVHTFLSARQDPQNPKCTLQFCARYQERIRITINLALCKFIIKLSFLPNSFLEHSILALALEQATHLSSLIPLLD